MIVDYKTRKKEVLDSYESVEQIISELKDYAKKIQLPDPTERLEPLLKDVRSKAEKVKADKFNLMIAGESKSGKSTFIKKFMDLLVIPNIDNTYKKERAKDELPQSAGGKTIMTTEPKFVPNEAIEITLDNNDVYAKQTKEGYKRENINITGEKTIEYFKQVN